MRQAVAIDGHVQHAAAGAHVCLCMPVATLQNSLGSCRAIGPAHATKSALHRDAMCGLYPGCRLRQWSMGHSLSWVAGQVAMRHAPWCIRLQPSAREEIRLRHPTLSVERPMAFRCAAGAEGRDGAAAEFPAQRVAGGHHGLRLPPGGGERAARQRVAVPCSGRGQQRKLLITRRLRRRCGIVARMHQSFAKGMFRLV